MPNYKEITDTISESIAGVRQSR